MITHKHFNKIGGVIIVLMLIITLLFMNGEALGIRVAADADAENHSDDVMFTENDLDGDWDTEGAAEIVLNGDSAEITGNGAYSLDGNVVISAAGRYVVSGALTDGSIIVDAEDSSKVWILLNGVTVSCSDDAGIIVSQADKVFLTLAEGSENTVISGETYAEEAVEDGRDGAVFAHDDLTINGSGSLTVTAAYKHGIAANDDLVIAGGTITVTAAQDGIRANDSMRLCGVQITVTAEDDGIVTAGENALLYIESGSYNVKAAGDGIHSGGPVTVAGGSVTIAAGDDGIHSDTDFSITGGTIGITECYEGIEAVTIDIADGDISIVSTDDGLNANGGSSDMFGGGGGRDFGEGGPADSADMENGQTDGSGSDKAAENKGFRGRGPMGGRPDDMPADMAEEGQNVPASGGQEDKTVTEAEETWIHISGGRLTILNSSGNDADGIDSNGDILISGGTILVSLTGTGSNCAIDCNTEGGAVCRITGGTVIACGSSSMAEGFDASSEQCSILYNLSAQTEDGTVLTLCDADGNVLLNWEVPYGFTSASLSCPELALNGTYEISAGDTAEEVTLTETAQTAGTASGGAGFGMGPGGRQKGGFDQKAEEETAEEQTAEQAEAGTSDTEP